MKVEIREVDHSRGIVQITSPDQRFYARSVKDSNGNPIWDYVPSVTWICDSGYPKDERLIRWVGSVGNHAAEEKKEAGGDKGSKVHNAVKVLVSGGDVLMDDSFVGTFTNEPTPLTPKEYFALMTFRDWCKKERPQIVASEYTVWNERYRYAGTVDLLCRLKSTEYRTVHLIDIKTSANIYPSMRLQVSAYKHADQSLPKGVRLGILQLGYEKNKEQKWKYTPVGDCFELFLAARKMWIDQNPDTKPFQREYPLSLSLEGLVSQAER